MKTPIPSRELEKMKKDCQGAIFNAVDITLDNLKTKINLTDTQKDEILKEVKHSIDKVFND